MQRFKNLTKKSGKVASAILSAAMVTSMVLGTNVVEVKAATNDTEETPIVGTDADPSISKDEERATAAVTYLKEEYQNLPVNAGTTTGAIQSADGITTIKDYAKNKYELKDVTLTFNVDDKPTLEGKGKATLTIAAKASNNKTVTGSVVYTLDNGKSRAEKVKAEVENQFLGKDSLYSNISIKNFTQKINEYLADTVDEEFGLKLYTDISGSAAVQRTPAKNGNRGTADGTVTIEAYDAESSTGTLIAHKIITIDHEILTNQEVVDAANADLAKYIDKINESNVYFGAKSDTDSLKKTIDAFLESKNGKKYADEVELVIAGSDAHKLSVNDSAGKDYAGKATIKYKLLTKDDSDDAITTPSAVTEKTITLSSDTAKAEKIISDLEKYADKVGVTSTTTAGAFTTTLKKIIVNETAKVSGGDADITLTPSAPDFEIVNLKTYYGNDNIKVTGKFVQDDATATKDGKPTVTFNVTVNDATKVTTKTFELPSAETQVNAAKADVEAALNKLDYNYATTQEDVQALVDKTLEKYNGEVLGTASVVRNEATADKAGTATITVDLVDKRNTFTAKATAEKTFSFLSNTFVVKDGKKFYFDKNGDLLKNTFLQGTDSPDGYTYYIQNDGSVMQDRLTYHPNGKDVIYFDADGHEVFDAFVNVKKDVQGNAVDYIGYFGTLGGAYVNQTTYGNGVGAYSKDALFYINDYGVLENKGWFQNAAGNIGYAATNGTLTTSQWSLDQFGRKVYFQANGFLAKGLMTDGVKTYQLDETDGHLVGEF